METNFQKHGLKVLIAGTEKDIHEVCSLIKDAMPDHIIVELENGIIVKIGDEMDNQILEGCLKVITVERSLITVEEVALDSTGKTPEFWENIERMATISQAAKALAKAAKLNKVSVEELSLIVISLAKKEKIV